MLQIFSKLCPFNSLILKIYYLALIKKYILLSKLFPLLWETSCKGKTHEAVFFFNKGYYNKLR